MNTLNIAQWTLNTLNTGKFPPTSHCTSLHIIFFFHAKYATAARECRLYSSSFAKFNMASKKPPPTNIYDLKKITTHRYIWPHLFHKWLCALSSSTRWFFWTVVVKTFKFGEGFTLQTSVPLGSSSMWPHFYSWGFAVKHLGFVSVVVFFCFAFHLYLYYGIHV